MIYINEDNLNQIGINWDETINTIEKAVKYLANNDFAQPIKPYLRYRDLKNRIIAMPAFIGGDINISGIKWIASFPDNINKGIPRAHSVVILNNADTGQPVGIINTPLLSIIRTASVSGLVIKYYNELKTLENINIGITGFGPIGQYHLKMCSDILADKINKISIFDLRDINSSLIPGNAQIVSSWEEAYLDADIFISCTVSNAPYINKPPKPGSLHLNVSLRDYVVDVYDFFKNSIIVDNWEEVCRQKTDIEMMHLKKGLQEKNTKTIIDIVLNNCLGKYTKEEPIMFNPMGMAVFDMAIGSYYYEIAKREHIGQYLD